LILVVVGGAFVFSDLVMLKYLAVGLIAALLLDATVIRMFLVPAIMKMLGDDCWWAPQWMKRIQERLGLGEIELPDERKRPARPDQSDDAVLVGAGTPRGSRPPHDPTHPAVGTARAKPVRVPAGPPRAAGPSVAGTTRIPTAAPDEPPTTRLSKQRAPQQAPAQPAREDREIESWLGALRGGPNPAPPPRRRPPVPRERPGDEPTTAIAAQRPQDPESTEKLNTGEKEKKKQERRRGGGLSAQDLLRREGRL
jgi:RND superfamily putative drug exporter